MRYRIHLTLLLGIAFLLTPGLAQEKETAETALKEADAAFKEGLAFFKKRDYEKAIHAFNRAEGAFRRADHLRGEAIMLKFRGTCHRRLGRVDEALPIIQASLERTKLFCKGADTRDYATILNIYGSTLLDLGRRAEGVRYIEQALAMRERLYPEGHVDTSISLQALAIVLTELGRSEEALGHAERCLALRERLLPKDHPRITTALYALGGIHGDLGNSRKAVEYATRCLEVRKRIYGDRDHVAVARAINNLANATIPIDGKRAIELAKEALAMRNRLYRDRDHKDIVNTLQVLASAHKADADYAGEEKAARRAYEMAKRLGIHDTEVASNCLELIGYANLHQGKYAEAEVAYRQCVAIRKKVERPLLLARAYGSLGLLLGCMGKTEEALAFHDKEIAIDKRLRNELAVGIARFLRAGTLAANGRNGEAIKELDQVIPILLRAERPADAMRAYKEKGCCLLESSRYAEALTCLEKVLETVGEDDADDRGEILVRRAACFAGLRRFEEAERDARLAYALHRKIRILHPEHRSLAAAQLAQLLVQLGRYAEARPLLLEVVANLESFGGYMLAKTRTDLARCLYDAGEPAAALDQAEQAQATFESLAYASLSSSRNIGLIGMCLERLARYDEALDAFTRVYAMRRGNPDPNVVASGCEQLGRCLVTLRRPVEALPYLEKALVLREKHAHKEKIARSMVEVARCLRMLGRGDDALAMLKEADGVLKHPARHEEEDRAILLHAIGLALRHLERLEEARTYYEQALSMRRRIHPGDHVYVAESLDALGVCLRRMGRPGEALGKLREAQAMYERLEPDGSTRIGSALNNVGFCLMHLDRDEEALPYLERAVAIAQETGSPRYAIWANNLARTLAKLGRHKKAIAHYAQVIAVVESRRQHALGLTEQDRAGYFAKLKSGRVFWHMAQSQLALGREEEALGFLERGRARSFLDLMERGHLDPLNEARRRARESGRKEELARIESMAGKLRAAETEVGRLTYRLASGRVTEKTAVRELRTQLAVARTKQHELLRLRSRLVRDLLPAADPASPDSIRDALRPGERLLYYVITDEGSILFEVAPGKEPIRVHELRWPDGKRIERESIDRLARDYGASLARASGAERGMRPTRDDASQGAGEAEGERLFRALIPGSVWNGLKRARRVFVVPHGALHKLPLETLVVARNADPRRRRYWIDAGPPVVYATSGTELVRLRAERREPSSKRRLVALGDPHFEGEASKVRGGLGALTPLPGTRREVLAVEKAVGGGEADKAVVLLGERATRGALYEAAAGARYLHIATHCLANETEYASYSSLALTLPAKPEPDDDGFLRDEAVFALPMGFRFAGARSVIASLWRVDDQSTADLMSDFYRRLAAGKVDRLAAFTAARKQLRTQHPDPYYWAPFIFLGNPD